MKNYNDANNTKDAWGYFLTFRTYATQLHGDARGSVDPKHNKFGTPRINANPNLQKVMRSQCAESAFILNKSQRETVLQSIINNAQFFKWNLIAAHIRSNHVHAIIQSTISKEKTMAKLIAWAINSLMSI